MEKTRAAISRIISFIIIIGSLYAGFERGGSLVVVAFIIAIWILLDYIPFETKLPWWMHITFFVYVSHDMILEFYEKLLLIMFGNAAVAALIDYLLMPFWVYITIAFIAKIIMQCPLLWNVLTGNRTVEGC